MHITDAQLATYKEQGFLIIKNFLSDDEREAALDGFFTLFAPPYDQYIAQGKKITRQDSRSFLGITRVLITS